MQRIVYLVSAVLAVVACEEAAESPAPANVERPRSEAQMTSVDAATAARATVDDARVRIADREVEEAPQGATDETKSLGELLASLRERELLRAASVIDGRVKQESPKYDLTEDQAKLVARYLLDDLQVMPKSRELADILPRTTVELIRAVNERDVDRVEAEKIADYLLRLTTSMRFGDLGALDVSHSHVIGREWHQIDYSDEPMTWQSQKAAWEPQGVINFKRAEYIERYFGIVSKMKFFKRVYRPSGRLPEPRR